jgi:predicted nucleic acid-binding protein
VIVADASVVVEFLLGTPTGRRVAEIFSEPGADIQAPALLDVEVAQVLRRMARNATIGSDHGKALLELLQDLPIGRHGMDLLLPRIWQLRRNLTAYDAAYVALGEALQCPLLTLDERIAGASGLQLEVRAP